jgi:hypothetical protein
MMYDDVFIENTKDLKPIFLPCGGTAHFDVGSGISYRCECGATVGSIGMPQACKDEQTKWDNWKKLGGKGWDMFTGEQEK